MDKVLITGSSGIIGSVLQRKLPFVVRNFDLPEFDARGYGLLSQHLIGCIAIIHLAWNTQIDNYRSNYTDPDNFLMAKNAYEAAANAGIGRVIMASSIHADMPKQSSGYRSPYAIPEPDSPYGQTKVAIEELGKLYATNHNLGVVCVRFGWVSPDENARPDPAKPYPANEGWLSHGDCGRLITACINAPAIPDNYQIIWGLSRREEGGIHDLRSSPLWEPQDRYIAPLQ